MKLRSVHVLSLLLVAAPAGCSDDDPPAFAGRDALPAPDRHLGVDCALIACASGVTFKVPGFLARFGDDARIVDVTACRGIICGDARVRWVSDNQSGSERGDGGRGRVSGSLFEGDLTVSYDDDIRVPDLMPDKDQVSLKVVTSGGRQLMDFHSQITTEVVCPGGLGCGICEAVIVQLDSTDGGQQLDAAYPGSEGKCSK